MSGQASIYNSTVGYRILASAILVAAGIASLKFDWVSAGWSIALIAAGALVLVLRGAFRVRLNPKEGDYEFAGKLPDEEETKLEELRIKQSAGRCRPPLQRAQLPPPDPAQPLQDVPPARVDPPPGTRPDED